MTFDNTGDEPLVVLRYFGPGVNPKAPKIGDAKKKWPACGFAPWPARGGSTAETASDVCEPSMTRGWQSMTFMPNTFPKLHNATWPGVVGKGSPGAEPFIELDKMIELTANASVNGVKFDGIDVFLFAPHVDIDRRTTTSKSSPTRCGQESRHRLRRRPGLGRHRRRLGHGRRSRT